MEVYRTKSLHFNCGAPFIVRSRLFSNYKNKINDWHGAPSHVTTLAYNTDSFISPPKPGKMRNFLIQ